MAVSSVSTLRRSLPVLVFNHSTSTEIYTLSLHDALPISRTYRTTASATARSSPGGLGIAASSRNSDSASLSGCTRSEEHTSELQSLRHLVCRLLLEKKKNNKQTPNPYGTRGLRRTAETRH